MKIDLQNRVALVADGNSQLGRVICRQLAESGARVVALVTDESAVQALGTLAENDDLKVTAVISDITDFRSCEKTINEIESAVGTIDFVINNSEFDIAEDFCSISHTQWQDTMSINLDSVFNICRLLSDGMGERGFGRIINISSVYGRKGAQGKSLYSAAKFGVHGFTMALSQELARKGVTVNTVSPGHLKSDTGDDLAGEELNRLIADIPAARLGEAAEVASLVGFLCSEHAAYITGTDIAVNGGEYIY